VRRIAFVHYSLASELFYLGYEDAAKDLACFGKSLVDGKLRDPQYQVMPAIVSSEKD
jgi:hypothetical protein